VIFVSPQDSGFSINGNRPARAKTRLPHRNRPVPAAKFTANTRKVESARQAVIPRSGWRAYFVYTENSSGRHSFRYGLAAA
jgi:hypothetical protein